MSDGRYLAVLRVSFVLPLCKDGLEEKDLNRFDNSRCTGDLNESPGDSVLPLLNTAASIRTVDYFIPHTNVAGGIR